MNEYDFYEKPFYKETTFYLANLLLFAVVIFLIFFTTIYGTHVFSETNGLRIWIRITEITGINIHTIYAINLTSSIIITGLLIVLQIKLGQTWISLTKYCFGTFTVILLILVCILCTCIEKIYINPARQENLKNTSKPYIVNTDVYHGKSKSEYYLYCHIENTKMTISYGNYPKTFPVKMSIVMRKGSLGIPIVDDYKLLFYDEKDDLPPISSTVEEFYGKKTKASSTTSELIPIIPSNTTPIQLSSFAEYFMTRMPAMNKTFTNRVCVSFTVTTDGKITNVSGGNGKAGKVLRQAVKDMEKWNGEPIDGKASVTIEVDYSNGVAHFMFVDVRVKGRRHWYRDCYGLNEDGCKYFERIEK